MLDQMYVQFVLAWQRQWEPFFSHQVRREQSNSNNDIRESTAYTTDLYSKKSLLRRRNRSVALLQEARARGLPCRIRV